MSGTFSSPDLDEIVEEFTRQCRSGERPSVEEYAERYPEHAEEIRDLFPTLLAMEQAAPESEDELDQTSDSESSSSTLNASRPERLGDYRIIREIGRGGMGVVYEAEQESLGRHVALKILPAQLMADSKQRRRFTREARAAARLHHTNIVPVFGVGEADGISFYAMQFIPGMPLNEVLDAIRQQGSDIAAAVSDTTRKREIDGKSEEATASKLAYSMLSGQFAAPEILDSPSGSSVVLDQTVEGNPTSTPRQRVDTDADVSDPLAGASSSSESGVDTNTRRQRVVSNVDRTDPLAGASSSYGSGGNTSTRRQQVDPGTDSALSGSDILSAGHSSVSRSRSKKAYWESVARIGQQAAEALGYAHSQGVIHRDIKPGNLLLDLAGIVWITDFGLAKAEEEDDLTKTGDVLGTLRYMPPEALKGQADATSDIFSLGLTLYELVARRPAYDENDRHGLLKRITDAEVTPLRSLDHSVPRDLETIIHKSVAADPKDRYQDASEMAADLERFLSDEPIHARRMSLSERFTRWSRRNPVIAGLGAACAALLLAITAVSTFAFIRTNDALDLAKQREVAAQTSREQAELARDEASLARVAAEGERQNAINSARVAHKALYVADMHLASAAWRDNDRTAGLSRLQRHVPIDGSGDLRGFEWYYWRNQFDQGLIAEYEQPNPVLDVSLSSDTTVAVALIEGNQLALLRLPKLELVSKQTVTSAGSVISIALSPDKSKLVCGHSDGSLSVHDGETLEELTTLSTTIDEPVLRVAFRDDGALFVAANSASATLWRAPDFQLTGSVHVFPEKANISITDLAFDETTLLFSGCNYGRLGRIARVETDKDASQLKAIPIDFDRQNDHAIDALSPWKHAVLIATSNGYIRSIDKASGEIRYASKACKSNATEIALDRTAEIAFVGSESGMASLVNADTGDVLIQLPAHSGRIKGVRYAEEYRGFLTAGEDGRVCLWSTAGIDTRTASYNLPEDSTRNNEVLTISPDGATVLAGGTKGITQHWDVASGRLVGQTKMHASVVKGLAFTEKKLISVADDRSIFKWDSNSGKLDGSVLNAHKQHIHRLDISKDEKLLATGSFDTTVKLWRLSDMHHLKTLKGQRHWITGVSFLNDAKQVLATSWNGNVFLWDVATGKPLAVSEGGFPEGISSFDMFEDEQQFVTGGKKGTVLLWDVDELRIVREFRGHSGYVQGICVSPDQRSILTASGDTTARLWNVASGEMLLKLQHANSVRCGEFSHSGRTIITGSGGRVHFWRSGEEDHQRETSPKNLPIAEPPWGVSNESVVRDAAMTGRE